MTSSKCPSWIARSTAANGSGPPMSPCTLPRATPSRSGIATSIVQSAALRLEASGMSSANVHGPTCARRPTSSKSRGVDAVRFATTRMRAGCEDCIDCLRGADRRSPGAGSPSVAGDGDQRNGNQPGGVQEGSIGCVKAMWTLSCERS